MNKKNKLDRVLLWVAAFDLVFVVAMVVIFCITGGTPDVLIGCVFGATTGELSVCGWIKTTKEKQEGKNEELDQ